jgi:hypothetical protein
VQKEKNLEFRFKNRKRKNGRVPVFSFLIELLRVVVNDVQGGRKKFAGLSFRFHCSLVYHLLVVKRERILKVNFFMILVSFSGRKDSEDEPQKFSRNKGYRS